MLYHARSGPNAELKYAWWGSDLICITWSKLAEVVAICIRLDNTQASNFFEIEIKKVSITFPPRAWERNVSVFGFQLWTFPLLARWVFFCILNIFSLLNSRFCAAWTSFKFTKKNSTMKFVRFSFVCARRKIAVKKIMEVKIFQRRFKNSIFTTFLPLPFLRHLPWGFERQLFVCQIGTNIASHRWRWLGNSSNCRITFCRSHRKQAVRKTWNETRKENFFLVGVFLPFSTTLSALILLFFRPCLARPYNFSFLSSRTRI